MTHQFGPILKNSQKQVIYGTLLGGSSIICPKRGKNCYLAMRDCDLNWLNYKIGILQDFFKDGSVRKDKKTYRSYSITYPIFNEIRETFYDEDGEKIIKKETLEILTSEAWMVWFVDGGRKTKDRIYLRTSKYGEEGNEIFAEYFNSLDCECEIQKTGIAFTNKGAHDFLSIVAPELPDFLIKKYD